MTARGKFIALEGGEGTGKSTQARKLAEALEQAGHEVILTREPGGTTGAEAIRQLLLNPPGAGWGARAEALLFAAARSDHVEQLIAPALVRGAWVVCDRFLDSSRAYQGIARDMGDDAITRLHALGSGGLRPDLTLVITVPGKISAARIAVRDGDASDAIGGRDAAYHRRVNDAFEQFAAEDPDRFAIIDGDAAIEVIHERILQSVQERLEPAS